MEYLNRARMAEINATTFRNRRPFPWINVQGFVTPDGFQRLCDTLPDISMFRAPSHGTDGYGDRYALQYRPSLEISEPWQNFIAELRGAEYLDWLRRLFGISAAHPVELTMHWHFEPAGYSIAPHVDARRKIGSHIFYFNTEADWDPHWGGQTLILDDGGRLVAKSRPDFRALQQVAASEILGNRSLLFQRSEHSWHGVRPLQCPSDRLRKVFIVVVNRMNLQVLWRHLRGKDADGHPMH